VIGIDLLPITPVPGATFLGSTDFTQKETFDKIKKVLENGPSNMPNVVISDMSPNASGIKFLDHQLSTELCLSALKFSLTVLPKRGHFACKLLQGPEQKNIEQLLSKFFKNVTVFKPNSSRTDSTELYLVAKIRLKNK
jgi:23S rRNA (uridine2552-2'-O)-methyltransferase